MKKALFGFSMLVGLFLASIPMHAHSRSFASVATSEGPTIRVLLHENVNTVLLEAKGAYRVVRPDTGKLVSYGRTGKRFPAHAMPDGMRWGEEYPDVHEFKVIPDSPLTRMFVNGIQYTGSILIGQTAGHRFFVVNEVPVEEYLRSTLAHQLNVPLSKEAAAAWVITARTAATHLAQSNENFYDIDAHSAGYFGQGVVDRKNGVEEAIAWTRFMVMESRGGQPLAASWSQNAGLGETLSLSGAEELARRGYDAMRILETYFPAARVSVTYLPPDLPTRYIR